MSYRSFLTTVFLDNGGTSTSCSGALRERRKAGAVRPVEPGKARALATGVVADAAISAIHVTQVVVRARAAATGCDDPFTVRFDHSSHRVVT